MALVSFLFQPKIFAIQRPAISFKPQKVFEEINSQNYLEIIYP